MSRTIKIIFTLSVLANLVLAGTLIGMTGKMRHHYAPPHDISEEAKTVMRETYKASGDEMKAQFMNMREKREALQEVVTAEEFDVEAYEKAVEDILESREAISESKAEMMGGILSKLSVEDRKKVSKRLLDGLSGRSHKHGKKGQKHHKNKD